MISMRCSPFRLIVAIALMSCFAVTFAQPALADYVGAVKADKEAVKQAFKEPGYSP